MFASCWLCCDTLRCDDMGENYLCEFFSVCTNAIDEVRFASAHEAQANDEQPGRRCDAAVVNDLPRQVEYRNVEPAVVSSIADGPYDGADILGLEVYGCRPRSEADGAGGIWLGRKILQAGHRIDPGEQALKRLLRGRGHFRKIVEQAQHWAV